ncbi:DNA polymerase I [Pseudobutyrivibrio xylanivorans]|uniref:DNA polymerase I n=1 Tax=Pseudobutyrivibrio xylanivorans TaxID=185007 RepID=A0A5P6VR90_PSEXY|nr:DNA polymerase I [Pseudobutyrivibrio xylanivorans]QFJ55127.1 DNA polymerase I [Pseudobutyrivibrio xylanivorans]
MSKLLLIDGHSIANRAFYGVPDLTNSQGQHTGAIFGFMNMMLKFIEDEQPDNFAVAFDLSAPTFRHKMFEAYKGTRKPMLPELKEQIPRIQEMLKAMGVPVVTKEGWEADDILGTLARIGEEKGFDVTIVSGDRDLLQLATEKVKISIPKTKKTGTEIENYYAADVKAAYDVTPKQFIDVKALQGDASDNIPGVEGIGPKTAQKWIAEYGSIEECHAHVDEMKKGKVLQNFIDQWDMAVLSKELATINVNAPIELEEGSTKLGNLFTEEAYLLCKQYELKKLLPRFEATETAKVQDTTSETFKRIYELADVEEFFDMLKKSGKDFVGASIMAGDDKRIKGVALSVGDSTIYVDCTGFITSDYLAHKLIEISKAGVKLCFWNLKDTMHLIFNLLNEDEKAAVLEKGGKAELFPNADDVAVAAYLHNPIKNEYTADDVAQEILGIIIPAPADLFGKKKLSAALEDDSFLEAVTTYACYNAYVAYASYEKVIAEIEKEGMLDIYKDIELPLTYTLFDMELQGIAMDAKALSEFGDKLSVRINELEQCIYKQAGEEFNINSPKQLGVILFEKLGIEGGKKTKTGYSTAADVLEELSATNPIISDILEYRQLAKLRSTYVEGLAACLDEDGRIRSTFMQTVTATGRISSTEPNLQNIPIRMELGREIRKVFFAKEGCTFLDADYSQIELRVLAHMSGDENLINAFKAGQDIHRSTASLVFDTPFDEVTDLQRRRAKAVNFGIVYGISAFGLAKDIGVGRKEAQEYIDNYFKAYPAMHTFLEDLKSSAKETGYATTMYGRRRPVPELASSNFMTKQFGERVAMNSPIQGTAADIIKIAMVNVHDRLLREGLKSKLLLQVHDELLVETYDDERQVVEKLIAEEMEGAAALSVQLEIDMNSGKTWDEAH